MAKLQTTCPLWYASWCYSHSPTVDKYLQGCALAAPGRHRWLTFDLGRLKKKSGRLSGRLDVGLCEKLKRNEQTYWNGAERNKRKFLMLPRSLLARKTKALIGAVQQHGLLTLKIVASVLYNLFHTTYHAKIILFFACEKLHDICTSMYWRYFYWSGLCFMFHFCVSTVLTVERVINKTKLSFMQIFVYLISFVRGMQDVYQHHIWRLARNCNHSIQIWWKRKFKMRTLLFRNLFQRSWKKFLSGFSA